MATKCLSLAKGRRIRLTREDACGRPVFGEHSTVVSKGFISVALTANTVDTDEINVVNANGERCVYEPSETNLVGYAVEVSFCEVDPDLFALATGQSTYEDADGNSIGFTVNTKLETKGYFGLELWAGAPGGDACENPDAETSGGYLLLPFLGGGIVGDFTVENGAVTFVITGAATRDGNRWGVGPYNDILFDGPTLGPLPTALDPNDALLTILTNANPPAAVCGARPLLDPSVDPLTAVTGTATTGHGASIAFTPLDIVAPIYVEFGDGTWDYLPSSASPVIHTYPAAGTYTVSASSNGVWVTDDVTVA